MAAQFKRVACVTAVVRCARKETGEVYARLYLSYPEFPAEVDTRGHEVQARGVWTGSINVDAQYFDLCSRPGRYDLVFVERAAGGPRLVGAELVAESGAESPALRLAQ